MIRVNNVFDNRYKYFMEFDG